jgi:ATP synthase protein I
MRRSETHRPDKLDHIVSADPPDDPADEGRREQASAWHALNLVIAGVAFWGGIGWLVARWLDSQLFTGLGVMVGAGAALYLVWIRYGRA